MKLHPLLLLLPLGALTASAADALIVAPAKRLEVIEFAQKRVTAKAPPLAEKLKNPFSMSGFEAAVAVAKTDDNRNREAPSGQDLLAMIANKIDAKARVVVSGEPMLLTAKQRLRAGSKIPITHDGLIYEVEIVSIETAQFTVRYKTDEYTRPITLKPTGK